MKSIVNKIVLSIALLSLSLSAAVAQQAMQNVMGRDRLSLNGRWAVLPDIMDMGISKNWGNPTENSDPLKLNELQYSGGETLAVPGDWNSQCDEYFYYESPMWYQRTFYYAPRSDRREFLHFGAVANHAIVYLNGEKLGEHHGAFTPFQFEVSDMLKEGENSVVVRVDNRRTKSTIPALAFDWWNYGGITRDVDLVSTPKTYIKDYWVRLKRGSRECVVVDVEIDGEQQSGATVNIKVNGTKIAKKLKTDENGRSTIEFRADLELWSPSSPKLYDITIESEEDCVDDKIGFRSFEVRGSDILLNGEPIFLRGVNIHEEIARDRRRSINRDDAEYLCQQAQELGCNFIRLSHYPHNEYMVRLCEERGIIMWEEIPVWQSIDFADPEVCQRITNMMYEMISRDKNRCAISIWSVSNETQPNARNRTEYLTSLIEKCRQWDDTRAVSSALDAIRYIEGDDSKLVLQDPLAEHLDIIGVNKYMGWYQKWLDKPENTEWITIEDKPLIISEFGAEAIYANYGDGDNLNSWSEDYMSQAYRDNLTSFEGIPNLRGTSPWILFDFRSPRRAHAMYQQGWNRKGLLSPEGNRKQAWHIMRDYYQRK
ncbi:MAG: glycoside hydrolase family 2 TIM barrel-domain containing protein [Rikenellaceae bacterium]